MQVLHRSRLKFADYNPRTIDPYALKGLRDSLKRYGMVQPPVWNSRSGNVVGGHQRLRAWDDLRGGTDYELTVYVVDLDDKAERALNVALNNPAIEGVYDLDRLSAVLSEIVGEGPTDNLFATGFDVTSLEAMYIDQQRDLPEFLAPPDSPLSQQIEADLEAVSAEVTTAKDVAAEQAEAEKIDRIKQAKADFREQTKAGQSGLIYVVVTFPDSDARARVLERLGTGPEQEYIDGVRLASELGVELTPPSSPQKKPRRGRGREPKNYEV